MLNRNINCLHNQRGHIHKADIFRWKIPLKKQATPHSVGNKTTRIQTT